MARNILIIGKSSTGKSTSLRTLDPKTTFVITPNDKSLPFPGSDNDYTHLTPQNTKGNVRFIDTLKDIRPFITQVSNGRPEIKTIVLEDFSHYLTHKVLSATFVKDSGYGKWNVLGSEVYQALFSDLKKLRPDLMIVVIHHTQELANGEVVEKSAGKLMDNTIEVSSWFTEILHSMTLGSGDSKRYVMQTNESGPYLAKSPPGMFKELHVGNNMKNILDDHRAYYAGTPKYAVKFID